MIMSGAQNRSVQCFLLMIPYLYIISFNLSLYQTICLSMYVSLSLPLTPCLYFSIYLSIAVSLSSFSLSLSVSISLSLSHSLTRPLSVSISISPSFFQSLSPSIYLSIYLSMSPSLYQSVSIHLFLILALIPSCPSILSSQLMSAMDTISGGPGTGKVVSLLEGGYDTQPQTLGLARCVDAHVKALRSEGN